MMLSYFFCEMGLQESTKIVIISIIVWTAYAADCKWPAALSRRMGTAGSQTLVGEAPAVISFTDTYE